MQVVDRSHESPTRAAQTFAPPIFAQTKRLLCLLVESNENARAKLKTLLALQNVEICEARDGEEAVDSVVRKRPDLIVMNGDLPRLSGFEAARLIRSILAFNRVPIILLGDSAKRAKRSVAFGVDNLNYFVRFLDLSKLENVLEKALTAARSKSETHV